MAGSLGAAWWSPSGGLVWGLKGTGQESVASKSSGTYRIYGCSLGSCAVPGLDWGAHARPFASAVALLHLGPTKCHVGGSGTCEGGCRRLFRFSAVSLERAGVCGSNDVSLARRMHGGGSGRPTAADAPKRVISGLQYSNQKNDSGQQKSWLRTAPPLTDSQKKISPSSCTLLQSCRKLGKNPRSFYFYRPTITESPVLQ